LAIALQRSRGGKNHVAEFSSVRVKTKDMPRRVWVKKYTVQAHARTPPKGTKIFTWRAHAKKHREAAKKKNNAAKKK